MSTRIVPRPTVVWYVTRDSDISGVLLDRVEIWRSQPAREPLTSSGGWCWWHDDGCAQQVTLEDCRKWCGTVPETDLEMLKIERYG